MDWRRWITDKLEGKGWTTDKLERKVWTVDVDGGPHAVVLHWTYFGGHRELEVDGRVVGESTVPMRWRSEQAFEIAGHRAVVRTQPARRVSPWFVITLEVEGKAVAPDPGESRWEA